ncbi:ABC transporter ATP-binding protein [Kribbella albertanoniae]|uniref:ABC transporter ATP-binding protein n=1 Tax=Kribbella albertanoniae TaxID=1266829 RepID=A0A4R4P3F0_9ACTN|nr:ABC transporter ATP-binding protein [Kribbella albertanoniae]TDC16868.1 ABC transporter ATP-binding protein [Kribbella albertanoniae]
MEVVRLVEVSKRFGRREILRGVDLRVEAGELLALVGANGSGKSTVLKLMVGLSRPTSGTVRRTAQVVSYVPDVFTSHDRLSASAYLRHLGRIRGLSSGAARERSSVLLERLALTGGADTPMRKLSKGNAQKVALAQALLTPPELLVLDEPWAGLDATAHETLRELLTETARAGAAVAFTEHSTETVRSTATRTCELHERALHESTSRENALPKNATPERALTEIVLAPGPELDWSGRPEVVEVRRNGNGTTLLVVTGQHDAVLLSALSQGCSVRQVNAQ